MRNKLSFGIAFLIVLTTLLIWNPFKKDTYYFQIPTRLSTAQLPLVDVEIQGNKYSLAMDLGSKFQLTLNKDALDPVNKEKIGTAVVRDIQGNSYETSTYSVPLIKIDTLSFDDVRIQEDSPDFIINTTFWVDPNGKDDPSSKKTGSVGRALLGSRNLLFDFKNSRMFISNDIKQLNADGYDLENFSKCPFEMGRTGPIVIVNTEMGKARLSIDTGSTKSWVRSSFFSNYVTKTSWHGLPVITTSKFEIAGKDFGNMDLYLQNITPELTEIDGVLGMDFLRTHVLYIDHKDKMVYVGDSISKVPAARKTHLESQPD